MTKETKENVDSGRKNSFLRKLLINIGCMVIVGFIVGWITLIWLDVWTSHGDEVPTPSVKGMPYDLAKLTLNTQGFGCELIDSVYDTTRPPGTVTEQNPKEGAMVKEGREIYLTVTAFSPRMVALPRVTDVSERQARAMLAGIGIKNITVITVPSEYKDLVAGMRVDGRSVAPGTRVPVTSRITLEVGSGPASVEPDTALVEISVPDAVTDL